MPSRERCEELRADAFADDLDVTDPMLSWTEEQVVTYFESGGQEEPRIEARAADMASLSMCQQLADEITPASDCELESARSSIDGWVADGRAGTSEVPTVPYADVGGSSDPLGSGDPLGADMEMGAEMIDEDILDADGEERTEDALLDENPMSSVPVTRPPSERTCDAPPPAYTGAPAVEEEDGVGGWSIRELKDFLAQRGADTSTFSEKRELVAEVRRLRLAAASGGLPATPPPPSPTSGSEPCAEPSAKFARLLRKVEDIKGSGDAAFKLKDFEKADRHYSSALQRAAETSPEEPLPSTLLGAIFSNRSSTRLSLQRPAEALEDGRMALKYRPGWARATCRVGAALIALRRLDEAKAAYEAGLQTTPGSAELHAGLTDVLGRLGKSAGSSEAAAAAKARGNDAFKAGRLDEACVPPRPNRRRLPRVAWHHSLPLRLSLSTPCCACARRVARRYAAYSEALRAAPSDETLYSNRSATLAKLERYDEALADGKRAVSLQPAWGKAYSRAGLAALKGGDEEASYWFYSNGLLKEPSNAELLRGRDSTLQALYALHSARNRRRVERFERDAHRPAARVFAVSDVHYDHPGAKEWAASLSKTAYKDDAIIVAGDVGDTFLAVKLALRAFKAVFRRVFYVPGNHDMWIRPAGQHSNEPAMFADSVQKLLSLWQMCDENDIDVGPARLSPSVTVVPLDAWYSYTFDHFDPRPGSTLFDKFCKWPMHYDSVWEFMTGLNEARLQMVEQRAPNVAKGKEGDVITFSHFLPRQELPLPGVHEMAKASGCLKVEEQLRRVHSKLHVFGHTHINTTNSYTDAAGHTCTYVQNAMGYGIAPGTRLCVVHDRGHFKSYMA